MRRNSGNVGGTVSLRESKWGEDNDDTLGLLGVEFFLRMRTLGPAANLKEKITTRPTFPFT